MGNFDQQLFLYMNADDNTAAGLIGFARLSANHLILLVPVLLAGLWLWGENMERRAVLKALFVTGISLCINAFIGLIWFRARPFAAGIGHTYITHAPDASFPSDHATIFAAVGFSLLVTETKWVGRIVLMTGLIVAWSRIFLGVHYPLDMLGAVMVAYGAYRFLTPLWNRTGEKITGQAIKAYRRVMAPLISAGWIHY